MLRRAFRTYGPRLFARKTLARLAREARALAQWGRDNVLGSFGARCAALVPVPLQLSAADVPEDLRAYLAAVAPEYLGHRFDLLGSGWVPVAHGTACSGLEGIAYAAAPAVHADPDGDWLAPRVTRANRRRSRAIWRMIAQPAYRPIDWQLDFKSGYRWRERSYFRSIRTGPVPGADIKLPWELARMQHLPQLALCVMLSAQGDRRFARPEVLVAEIEAQLLDFIATNPPRFGVNWACPMDIAIRVANWLLTLDLLASAGVVLRREVAEVVTCSISNHVEHVAAHLEWSEMHRTNHYLANIVGILYAALRMESSARSDAYLAFAVRELVGEGLAQFHPEGSCYEGSTNYHRLSAEMLVHGAALAVGIPRDRLAAAAAYRPAAIRVRPPFPPGALPLRPGDGAAANILPAEFVKRLWRSGQFLRCVIRPDGDVCQIGDTDSGRLFWLHPSSAGGMPPHRNDLDHAALGEMLEALFSPTDRVRWMDSALVRAFAGRAILPPAEPLPMPGDFGDPDAIIARLRGLPAENLRVRHFRSALPGSEWRRSAFPQFGVYVFRRNRDLVLFRCAGPVPPGAPTGHLHDDNLGMELMLDGLPRVVDPGTYVYTPLPEQRNLYRDAAAHDVPRAAGWQVARPGAELFLLASDVPARCICWRPDAVAGEIVSAQGSLCRLIRIGGDAVEVWDASWPLSLAHVAQSCSPCKGYGKKT